MTAVAFGPSHVSWADATFCLRERFYSMGGKTGARVSLSFSFHAPLS